MIRMEIRDDARRRGGWSHDVQPLSQVAAWSRNGSTAPWEVSAVCRASTTLAVAAQDQVGGRDVVEQGDEAGASVEQARMGVIAGGHGLGDHRGGVSEAVVVTV